MHPLRPRRTAAMRLLCLFACRRRRVKRASTCWVRVHVQSTHLKLPLLDIPMTSGVVYVQVEWVRVMKEASDLPEPMDQEPEQA